MMVSINVESKIIEFQVRRIFLKSMLYPTVALLPQAAYLYALSQSSSRPNEEMKSFSSWSHMSFQKIMHSDRAT